MKVNPFVVGKRKERGKLISGRYSSEPVTLRFKNFTSKYFPPIERFEVTEEELSLLFRSLAPKDQRWVLTVLLSSRIDTKFKTKFGQEPTTHISFGSTGKEKYSQSAKHF